MAGEEMTNPPRSPNRLQYYREEQMLSRHALSRLAGVNHRTIFLIETQPGEIRISTKRKLLTALGIPFNQVTKVFPE